jgi:hypothetical protein
MGTYGTIAQTRVFKDQEAVAVAFDDVISAVYCK